MNRLIIPIESLKYIESWLKTAIGYDPVMFEEEFTEISNRLESEEESELYLKLTYKDNPALTGDFHDDALLIGKNLVIPIYPISDGTNINQEEIKAIFDKHITSPTKQDEDAYFRLLMLSAIYYKHKATTGFFGIKPFIPITEGVYSQYIEVIRKLSVELSPLINKTNNKENPKFVIKYGSNKCTLSNELKEKVMAFLEHQMRFSSPQLIEHELHDFPMTYQKEPNGRIPLILTNNILLSTHNILRCTSLHKSNIYFSKEEALFIIEYSDYLDRAILDNKRSEKQNEDIRNIDPQFIKNLRTTIDNLNVNKYIPRWWNPFLFAE